MVTKSGEKSKVTLNLSPTSVNLFYQSPLLFYLTYIEKVEDDTPVPVCYGLSGNIVHECLEKYANGEVDRDEACIMLMQVRRNRLRRQVLPSRSRTGIISFRIRISCMSVRMAKTQSYIRSRKI